MSDDKGWLPKVLHRASLETLAISWVQDRATDQELRELRDKIAAPALPAVEQRGQPGDCPMCIPPSSCPGGAHRNALYEDGIETPEQYRALAPPDDKDAIIGQSAELFWEDPAFPLPFVKAGLESHMNTYVRSEDYYAQEETIRQLTELLREYRYSTKNSHSYSCIPARFYPGLGFMDDRCSLCVKADTLLEG